MFEKLESVVEKFNVLEQSLSRSDLSGQELTRISKERAAIEEIVQAYLAYKKLNADLKDAEELLADPDMRDMAREEVEQLNQQIEETEQTLKLLMLPQDPNDAKNVVLEIRAGTGGDEAALFASDLFRMYSRYADQRGWRVEILSSTEGAVGGYKEIIALVSGDRVFSSLKFERGAHRVQRVPDTETQGRIHTSACTVAVLPEADEVEIDINPSDLEITLCRASGAGGQHINTTDSAVRIVHKPSGIAVECQDERSQHKNKAKAMKVLQARLLEKAQQDQADAISADRKSQVGTGDRSERIRTYNFPQGRVTDHRINLTLYKLDAFMEGDIHEVVDALITDHQAQLLKAEFGDAI